MSDGKINLDDISTGYEQLPIGAYSAKLTAASSQEPKKPGQGETLVLTWTITGGPHEGQTVYAYYSFTKWPSKEPGGKPKIFGVSDLLNDFAAAGVPFDPAKESLYESCQKNAKLAAGKLGKLAVRINIVERKSKDGEKSFRNVRVLEAVAKPAPKSVAAPVTAAVAPDVTEDDFSD